MWVKYSEDEYKELFLNETKFYNEIILGSFLSSAMYDKLPHFIQTLIRNIIASIIVYLFVGLLWSYIIYYWKPNYYIPKDNVPSLKSMLLQIKVAMKAIPWYALYVSINEHIIESGFTKCFPRIKDVGLVIYFVNIPIYLMLVEFGIYWMHRQLHDFKLLYKHLHATHHIYNKQSTLSPFAGLAFHPIDGILQSIPHVIALFIVPMQFRTHMVLFFLEGLWTTNIHDCIHGQFWPIMGAGYHTIHHTTYRHNYGHYTVFMDWMFGTLRDPKLDNDETIKVK